MPSIVNGLFSGRSGLASHGISIAVIGDNIANASTIGYKTSRAEFADLMAGGQTAGKVVGSGSTISAITTIFEQGTTEFTGRPLDLAIDGNGFFVVADGPQKYYTRAGNFKVDESGFIVNQNGLNVLGFPATGSGALEPLSATSISQNSVRTQNVAVAGNVNAASTQEIAGDPAVLLPTIAAGAAGATPTTYATLSASAEFSTVVDVFDSLGSKHTITLFFFKDSGNTNRYYASAYVNSDDVDSPAGTSGVPRHLLIGGSASVRMDFNSDGTLNATTPAAPLTTTIPWNNGSNNSAITLDLSNFTQYATSSNITSITQDGQGVGTVTSLSVEEDGSIFAILSNGQASIIGTLGLVNFSSPEGLVRIGDNLLQQSLSSGEPIIGQPGSGTFGEIASGSIELSTVDIANEFVKLITVQRGFQANSRIITTINQLLSEIIQLA
ncbi:MAG: flagellar hook protein FlgE [Deltaproteobacteria bacterium]|nr:flagellar hook protein FlgE [Deltaproteobacteria bacterium]